MLIMLIPTSVFLMCYAYFFSDYYAHSLKKELHNKNAMLTTQISDLADNMSFISLELLNRSSFLNSIKKLYFNSDTPQKITKNYAEIADDMVTYGYFQDTYQIIWLDKNGYYYNTNFQVAEQLRVHRISQEELASYQWYADVTASGMGPVFLNLKETAVTDETGSSISFVRSIAAPTDRIGLLIVQVDLSERLYLFEALENSGADYAIAAEDGSVLYASERFPEAATAELLGQQEDDVCTVDGQQYMVSVCKDAGTGIHTVALFPKSIYWQRLAVSLLPSMVVIFLAVVLTSVWIVHFSKRFSRPLLELTDMIRETTLDDLRRPRQLDMVKAPDEVQYLHTAYLHMLGRIDAMVEEKLAWVSREAEMRLRFLQYQINPHFIYNTLNVIGIMGVEAHSEKIHEACQMLAQLLRYSLEDYSKKATFQEEVSSIHAYLRLMKLRYEYKLHYHLDYDQRLGEYSIARFTLQPFVENVFEHAFDSDHPTVTLRIALEMDGEMWRITVEDNGAGMTRETEEKLRQSIDQSLAAGQAGDLPVADDGIGVKNTIVRLFVLTNGELTYDIQRGESGCRIMLCGRLMR